MNLWSLNLFLRHFQVQVLVAGLCIEERGAEGGITVLASDWQKRDDPGLAFAFTFEGTVIFVHS